MFLEFWNNVFGAWRHFFKLDLFSLFVICNWLPVGSLCLGQRMIFLVHTNYKLSTVKHGGLSYRIQYHIHAHTPSLLQNECRIAKFAVITSTDLVQDGSVQDGLVSPYRSVQDGFCIWKRHSLIYEINMRASNSYLHWVLCAKYSDCYLPRH